MFELVDAIALADPTAANRTAVKAFADGAERYFDPNLTPAGGYATYPGMLNPDEHVYFDDNGWWAMSFLDAYKATRDPRYVYVEGPMIGAQLELCAIRHTRGPCVKAEQLARASLAAFQRDLHWTPAADAVYLRFILALYARDHEPIPPSTRPARATAFTSSAAATASPPRPAGSQHADG